MSIPEHIRDMPLLGLLSFTALAMFLFVRVDRPLHKVSTVGFWGVAAGADLGIYDAFHYLPGFGL